MPGLQSAYPYELVGALPGTCFTTMGILFRGVIFVGSNTHLQPLQFCCNSFGRSAGTQLFVTDKQVRKQPYDQLAGLPDA